MHVSPAGGRSVPLKPLSQSHYDGHPAVQRHAVSSADELVYPKRGFLKASLPLILAGIVPVFNPFGYCCPTAGWISRNPC